MTMYTSVVRFIFFISLCRSGEELERLMRAVMIVDVSGSNTMRLQDIPIPKPGNNQVLIDVLAAGIGPVDEYLNNGLHHYGLPVPYIPGKEIAGLVEAQHETANLFKKYDRVYCGTEGGGYADYALADQSNCYPLPRNLTFSQGGALFESYFNAHRALITKAQIKSNETILIHGAKGGLGVALIQIAKSAGAYVVVSVIDKDVENGMKKAGADNIVYYNKRNYLDAALNKIRKIGCFNVIFEFTVTANLKHQKNCLAANGRLIIIGNGTATTVTKAELEQSNGLTINFNLTEYTKKEQSASAEYVDRFIKLGFIKPVIGNEYRLEQFDRAQTHVRSGVAARGKSIFSQM